MKIPLKSIEYFLALSCVQTNGEISKHAQPDGRCNMRLSWIVKDYIIRQFHFYVYISPLTAGSLRIFTW